MKNSLIIIFLVVVANSLIFAQVDLELGLVGYYKMDEGEGATAFNSATGEFSVQDGELVREPQWVEGKFGSGLRFISGDGQPYVNLGTEDIAEAADQLSISVWINWDGLDGNWHGICGKRDDWEPELIMWSMVLDANTGGIQFETNTEDGKVFIITPDPPPVGEWLHVALIFDGEWAAFYFDGQLVVDGDMVLGYHREASFHFGCGVIDGGAAFAGVLDELRFYDRALTEEEIGALANNDPSAVDENISNSALVQNYSLSQNYPNPFNPTTSIQYSVAAPGHNRLKVYNARGEEVRTLVNSFQRPGVHSIRFDAESLPGGIYVYKLQTGNQIVKSRKMLLVK